MLLYDVVNFAGSGYSSHLALLSCWRNPSGVMSTDVAGAEVHFCGIGFLGMV